MKLFHKVTSSVHLCYVVEHGENRRAHVKHGILFLSEWGNPEIIICWSNIVGDLNFVGIRTKVWSVIILMHY